MTGLDQDIDAMMAGAVPPDKVTLSVTRTPKVGPAIVMSAKEATPRPGRIANIAVSGPVVLDVTPAEYHQLPGFSSSIAKVLIAKCAEQARDKYDRKIEEVDDDGEELTDQQQALRDRGTVLHALVLGKGAERIAIQNVDAYTTKVARADRDAARAAGLVPVKAGKFEIFERSAIGIRAKLALAGHKLIGQSEVAIAWTEDAPDGPVRCRAMLDHLEIYGDLDGPGPIEATIYDLKIVGDASPQRCERTAESLGYAIQAAAYTRAVEALYPRLAGRVEFRFLFVEPHRPYGLWDPQPDGVFAELGLRRWKRAVADWSRGVATGHWPDYRTDDRARIEAPLWVLREEGMTVDG